MKIQKLALSFAIAASACTLQAQQSMPDMPGMKMDPPPTKPQQAPAPRPNRTKNVPDPMPGDMKSMSQDAADAKAKAAADSVTQSFQQQANQPQGKPGPGQRRKLYQAAYPGAAGARSDRLSYRHWTCPPPELLRDVVSREPMTVENFLALADKTNPTLSQAQRNVDRSKQQARQMGLPPDPIVGYSGDHIRGGEYHGGEEGAFFSQEFILGRKLALRRDIYRAEGRSNEYAVEIQKARIHNDVARAFFDALAAQQSVVVHDQTA